MPLDDPPPPVVSIPPTAPSAKDNAKFKPSTIPAPVATPGTAATPAPGATPIAPGLPTPSANSAQTDPTQNNPAHDDEHAPDDAVTAQTDSSPLNFSAIWNQQFMREALLAGVLVALMCGFLSVYVVLKRIVFIGVALSEFSSAGIALALFSGFNPLAGALGFMLLGSVMFALRLSPRRVPQESFIGIIYVLAGALAILLIAKSHDGETHILQLLRGDVLLIDPRETRQMLAAFAAIGAIHLLFIKPFVLAAFDRDAASTAGFFAPAWDLLLFLTLGAAIAFSIRACGTLLTTTMLILPAATTLLFVNRMKWVFVFAPIVAIVPVGIGLHLSLVADLPASAVIVALSFALFALSFAATALFKRS